MRTALPLLLLLLASATAHAQSGRERTQRAFDVVYELSLDNPTTEKLFPMIAIYERDRAKLAVEQTEITDQLRVTSDPAAADKLLDKSLATQRALLAVEQRFVTSLRKLLGGSRAARARMILFAPGTDTDPQWAPPAGGHDLFPPGSPLRGPEPCDPFAQMHGCNRR